MLLFLAIIYKHKLVFEYYLEPPRCFTVHLYNIHHKNKNEYCKLASTVLEINHHALFEVSETQGNFNTLKKVYILNI